MTEQSPPATEQQVEEQPSESALTEPLYGVEDVQRALGTSGERALAQSYFTTYTAESNKLGMTQAEAQQMIIAIQSNQPWPPAPEIPEGEAQGAVVGGVGGQAAEGENAPPEEQPGNLEATAQGGTA